MNAECEKKVQFQTISKITMSVLKFHIKLFSNFLYATVFLHITFRVWTK